MICEDTVGKPVEGCLALKASHEGGQVNIENVNIVQTEFSNTGPAERPSNQIMIASRQLRHDSHRREYAGQVGNGCAS